MRRHLLVLIAAPLALAGCNEAGQPTSNQTNAPIADYSPSAGEPAPSPSPSLQSPVGPMATGGASDAADATDECGASKAAAYRNALPSSDILAKIRAAVGHDRIRVIGPNDVVTMEFSPGRLNLETGVDGRIKTIRCG